MLFQNTGLTRELCYQLWNYVLSISFWEPPGLVKQYEIDDDKFEKSTNPDHKLTDSEGGHYTSACKSSGHSLHAFPKRYPKNLNLTSFTKLK